MLNGHSVLAIIPARGGSKRIPRKNIYPVLGKPLLSYATELMTSLSWVDLTSVSTDSQEIANVALEVRDIDIAWRPEDLSGDRIGDGDVLQHALKDVELRHERRFDVVLMIQPTSPLRTAEHVEACAKTLIGGSWDAVWSVSETDLSYHPLKQLTLEEGHLGYFDDRGQSIIARQQLRPVFHRNGVCYAFRRDFLLDAGSIWSPGKTTAVIVPGAHVSIDTLEDVAQVERIMAGAG